ncbi:hypothetical protein JCM18899A_02990 [Nocardioides sp. AN3]
MRIRRQPVADELMLDGELVLLLNGTVMVLSEVASAAVNRLSTEVWTSVEVLVDVLASSVGLPAEGEGAVFSLVRSLADAGVVVAEA